MTKDSLPFMNSTGRIGGLLKKIIDAKTPPKYTLDFQKQVLGFTKAGDYPFISLLKRIGFLDSASAPTDLYTKFRSESGRGAAMAEAIKRGFAPLYEANEYTHKMDSAELKDLIIQITGASKKVSTTGAISRTFTALKEYANFDAINTEETGNIMDNDMKQGLEQEQALSEELAPETQQAPQGKPLTSKMNLSYTINLNLPSSKDPEVFSAIFKSLKEHLLEG